MLRAFPVIRDSQKHKIGHIISLGIGALIVCYVVLAMLVDSPLGFWLKLGTTLLASWTAVMCTLLTANTLTLLVQHKHNMQTQTEVTRSDFGSTPANRSPMSMGSQTGMAKTRAERLSSIDRTLRTVKICAFVFTVTTVSIAGCYILLSSSGNPVVYALITVLLVFCSTFVTYLRSVGRQIFRETSSKKPVSSNLGRLRAIASSLLGRSAAAIDAGKAAKDVTAKSQSSLRGSAGTSVQTSNVHVSR